MGILMITDSMVDIADLYPERPKGEIGDIPGIGRFVKEASPARYTKYQTIFYETLREVNEISGTIKHYQEIGDYEKAREMATDKRKLLAIKALMNKYRLQLTKINNNIKKIWVSKSQSPEQKRENIKVWVTQKNEILKNVYNQLIKKEK
jgi:predicted aminopeptidase